MNATNGHICTAFSDSSTDSNEKCYTAITGTYIKYFMTYKRLTYLYTILSLQLMKMRQELYGWTVKAIHRRLHLMKTLLGNGPLAFGLSLRYLIIYLLY